MSLDLDEVWAKACPELVGPWDDLWALHRAGVPLEAMNDRRGNVTIGADDIAVVGKRWERRFRGERAFIVPATDPGGNIIDLVAFRLATPLAFWPLTGAAAALGEDEIDRANHFGAPLPVHECPLHWLQAGRKGCVVLDWNRYWPLHLSNVPALQFEDRAFAARATALMARPLPVPPALVRAA